MINPHNQAASRQAIKEIKFRELIVHVCKLSDDKALFNLDKLVEILFCIDFMHYRSHGVSITERKYFQAAQGPCPKNFLFVTNLLKQEGRIGLSCYERPFASHSPSLSNFSKSEIEFIQHTVTGYYMFGLPRQIQNLLEIPKTPGEFIPYEAVLVDKPEVTPELIGTAKVIRDAGINGVFLT